MVQIVGAGDTVTPLYRSCIILTEELGGWGLPREVYALVDSKQSNQLGCLSCQCRMALLLRLASVPRMFLFATRAAAVKKRPIENLQERRATAWFEDR